MPDIEATPSPWDCAHPVAELRAKRIINGGIQYRKQCQRCGGSVGESVSHSKVTVYPGNWDVQLHERWAASVRSVLAMSREQTLAERRSVYAEYLQTAEWSARRNKVLQREHFVCQGCMTARAVEVHHTTYKHIGRELLFELVALCRACHETAHGAEDDGEGPNGA